VVLSVARLEAGKGLDVLLRAAAHLPEATFAIAGDGPERVVLEALARALGVDERVRFLGFRNDVEALLAGCDVFVLPSLDEGFPLSVLEAMAACRPVVASDVGGVPEAITHDETGLLVPPGNPDALAAALARLLDDAPTRRRLAISGWQSVNKQPHAAVETMLLYERLSRGRE
jgi:glycosyltransferase involved in cell wall biosynthesis